MNNRNKVLFKKTNNSSPLYEMLEGKKRNYKQHKFLHCVSFTAVGTVLEGSCHWFLLRKSAGNWLILLQTPSFHIKPSTSLHNLHDMPRLKVLFPNSLLTVPITVELTLAATSENRSLASALDGTIASSCSKRLEKLASHCEN